MFTPLTTVPYRNLRATIYEETPRWIAVEYVRRLTAVRNSCKAEDREPDTPDLIGPEDFVVAAGVVNLASDDPNTAIPWPTLDPLGEPLAISAAIDERIRIINLLPQPFYNEIRAEIVRRKDLTESEVGKSAAGSDTSTAAETNPPD